MSNIRIAVLFLWIATAISFIYPYHVYASENDSTLSTVHAATIHEKNYYIQAKTKINLRLLYGIDSLTARVGDRVFFTVTEAIEINHNVVLPKNTIVVGTIKKAEAAGFLGQDGKLAFSVSSVETPDHTEIPVSCEANYSSTGDYAFEKDSPIKTLVKKAASMGTDVYCEAGTTYDAEVLSDTLITSIPLSSQ